MISSFCIPSRLATLACCLFSLFLLWPNQLKAVSSDATSDTTATEQSDPLLLASSNNEDYYHLDSAPDLQNFSKLTSLLGEEETKKLLPSLNQHLWWNDSFLERSSFSVGIRKSPLRWSEVTELLNYTASELGMSSPLYSEEVKERITCTQVLPSVFSWSSWFTTAPLSYTFQIKPGEDDQVAQLSFENAQRCLNIREVHYWLYCYLRKREQALRAGKLLATLSDDEDDITQYCKTHGLWPLLDSTHNHVKELIEKSPEIFNSKATFRLPTKEELSSEAGNLIWDSWYSDCLDDNSHEVRYAFDISQMKKESDLTNPFPSERLTRTPVAFATDQDQQKLYNQDREFKDDLKRDCYYYWWRYF